MEEEGGREDEEGSKLPFKILSGDKEGSKPTQNQWNDTQLTLSSLFWPKMTCFLKGSKRQHLVLQTTKEYLSLRQDFIWYNFVNLKYTKFQSLIFVWIHGMKLSVLGRKNIDRKESHLWRTWLISFARRSYTGIRNGENTEPCKAFAAEEDLIGFSMTPVCRTMIFKKELRNVNVKPGE